MMFRSSLPARLTTVFVWLLAPSVIVAGDGILIYQNTLGEFLFRPGRSRKIADDLTTLLSGECALHSLRVRVSGGVDGGGGTFLADLRLYDGCPSDGGIPITGLTEFRFHDLNDDASITHDLLADFSDRGICADSLACQVSQQNCADNSVCQADPLEIPPTVWVRIRFDTDDAGLLMGTPPQLGFSQDAFDEFLHCTAWFGGWPEYPHASFWAEVYASNDCPCNRDVDCDDGLFCNGLETCEADGTCSVGPIPCRPGAVCDEAEDECPCESQADCDDDDPCSGVEICTSEGICATLLSQDCNENAVEDLCDVEQGTSDDCDGDFVPDECQVAVLDCNGNHIPDVCDAVGKDCNRNGVPDDCDIATCPEDSPDCQDCDGNLIPDSCDIETDPSLDCPSGIPNGILDRCEVDCHPVGDPGSGSADTCDVTDGTSEDCNGNDVPDECDVKNERLFAVTHTFAAEFDLTIGEVTSVSGRALNGFGRVSSLAHDPNTNTLYGVDTHLDQLITIDVATGTGTVVGPFGFDLVGGLAFDANSNTLYGTDFGSDELITIDTATGTATAVGPLGFDLVKGLAFDQNTNTLYGMQFVSFGISELLTIDTATGASTLVGALGIKHVSRMAFDPATNTLYGTADSSLLTIDVSTGAGTVVGRLVYSPAGLAFDINTNTLYGMSFFGRRLMMIDTTTAATTSIGFLGFGGLAGLAFDPRTNTLYVTSSGQLITIDTETLTGKAVGPLGFGLVVGLAFDPNTNTLYGMDTFTDQVITINTATGAGTVVGPLGYRYVGDLAFDPNTNTLYAVDHSINKLITIDVLTGAGRSAPQFTGFRQVFGLTFDARTNTLYGADSDSRQLITIDVTSGVGTAIAMERDFLFTRGLAILSGGGGADCNENHVPDSCELAENDCNVNEVPDDCEPEFDLDGDGFLDDCDVCFDSDLSESVVINGCPTGVDNELLADGCTMNDLLGDCSLNAHNHGQFTSCVSRLANEWRRNGLLGGKAVGRLARCTEASNQTRPSKRSSSDGSRGQR